MCARCVSTVRVERKSCSAISALVWPRAISRRTSTSRSVRSSGGPAGSAGCGGERGAEARVEVVLAGRGEADRLEQLLVGGLLEHEAERAGLQRLTGEAGVVLHRQHDDRGVGRGSRRRGIASRLGLAVHVEVEHEHGRPVRAREALGVRQRAGLGDDLHRRGRRRSACRRPWRTTVWSSAMTIVVLPRSARSARVIDGSGGCAGHEGNDTLGRSARSGSRRRAVSVVSRRPGRTARRAARRRRAARSAAGRRRCAPRVRRRRRAGRTRSGP